MRTSDKTSSDYADLISEVHKMVKRISRNVNDTSSAERFSTYRMNLGLFLEGVENDVCEDFIDEDGIVRG